MGTAIRSNAVAMASSFPMLSGYMRSAMEERVTGPLLRIFARRHSMVLVVSEAGDELMVSLDLWVASG